MNFSTRAIIYEIFLILTISPIIFSIFNSKVKTMKNDILALSKRVSRGLTESPEEQVLMRNLFEKLEKSNKIKSPLKLPSLAEGIWSLEYTTSDSILGRNSYKRVGPIIQKIDVKNLKAENSETIDFFGLKINRKVSADLSPLTSSKVAVQFKVFTIGPISFNAPSSFKGELDITYVDEDLRLSRGDKGNIFVLSRL